MPGIQQFLVRTSTQHFQKLLTTSYKCLSPRVQLFRKTGFSNSHSSSVTRLEITSACLLRRISTRVLPQAFICLAEYTMTLFRGPVLICPEDSGHLHQYWEYSGISSFYGLELPPIAPLHQQSAAEPGKDLRFSRSRWEWKKLKRQNAKYSDISATLTVRFLITSWKQAFRDCISCC